MRRRVHSSPVNPCALAPLPNAWATRSRSPSDSLGLTPVGPLLASAWTPPPCQAARQRLALCLDTAGRRIGTSQHGRHAPNLVRPAAPPPGPKQVTSRPETP